MIGNRYSLLARPKVLLLLQASALVFFTVILTRAFSEGDGERLLMAVLAGICFLGIVYNPHWGVLIILTTWLINVDALGSRFLTVPYLTSAALLVPLALSVFRDRAKWLLQVPQIKIFLVIGVLFLISTWWSEYKYSMTVYPEQDETARLLQLFGTRLIWLIFFLYFITTRRKIETTVWLVLGVIVAVSFSALGPFLATGGTGRAAASFSLAENANRLAYICLFGTTLFWFYNFYGETSWRKTLAFPLLFFLPLTALTTGSRSGLLQMVALAALLVTDQKGWSATKRMCCILFMGLVALLVVAVVPASNLGRATTFDPEVRAPGQSSLQNRFRVVLSALNMVASDPFFGAGIGNFPWVARTYYGSGGHTHNSYLWSATSGGIGVLILYLFLFYVTYRMLKRLERSGPRDLLWLSKGLRINLLLFLVFSAFADFWLSDFLYLILGLTIAMTLLRQREEQKFAPTPLRAVPDRC